MANASASVAPFARSRCGQFASAGMKQWESNEYRRADGQRTLLMRARAWLGGESGYVVVFDDIRTSSRPARRGLGEVARRLAHEIKNRLPRSSSRRSACSTKLHDKLPDVEPTSSSELTARS